MAFGHEESPARGSDELIIFMGKGVEITGSIRFKGSGRLDGKVEGKVNVDGTLILGEGAMVSSEIEGDTIIVGGTVKGKILARQKVQLLKTSVVDCDITTPSLIIEDGAQFNGSAKMGTSVATGEISTAVPLTTGETKQKSVIQAIK